MVAARRASPNRFILPVFATVTYGALVIALFGFISLIADRDFIVEADAGPLLGPWMVAVACAATFVALVRTQSRAAPWATAVVAAASAYALMLVAGGLAYMVTRGELIWALLFAARYAVSPFVVGAAVLTAVIVIALWFVVPRSPQG